ncbi:hypothetical protein CC79DRAFT_1318367 [Sarocladium strictum]
MASKAVANAKVKPEPLDVDLVWQPEIDGELMQLFYLDACWDFASMDKTNMFEVLVKLQGLETLIPAFEERIRHSDEGFRAWKRLHQFEMDAERAQRIQMFVQMVKRDPIDNTTKTIWNDKKWETRYAWIVRQREDLAKIRVNCLKQLALKPSEEAAFFGRQEDRPARIIVHKGKNMEVKAAGRRINAHWNLPIDQRLRIAAGGPGTRFDEFKETFWGPVLGREPRLPESRILLPERVIEVKMESDSEHALADEGDKENIVKVKMEPDDHIAT